MSTLNVAISGLNAARIGLLTTNHNIANASTPGYSRQQIFQTTNTPMFTGAGFIGQGTSVETVRRLYSQQLNEQVLSASTGAAEMDSYLAQIRQIDNLLADPSAGLSPALSGFFGGVQEAAAHPASLPARQSMLSASQALVARFQAIDLRLAEIGQGVNAMIASEVTAINAFARQIADINQRVVLAQAAGPGQPANDLLDQRDRLIADLNTKIRATTLLQSDGTYSVFIGSGQPLVVGTVPLALQAVPSPTDPQRIVVAVQTPAGGAILMPESLLAGGSLGGLLKFRSESLDDARSDLGQIALTLARDFNAQHRLGQDLDGDLGGDYFDLSAIGVTQRAGDLALAIASPRDIALAAPIRTATPLTNTGTGSISAGIALDATNPNLWTTTTLNFVAGGYQINGAGPVIAHAPGANIDHNGWRVVVSGTPAAGDVFTIERNSAGVADNRNAMLLGALQTANTMAGGTATYQSAYSTLVAQIGNRAREVEITGQAQQSLLQQAQTARDRMSGVNLDEEAANLLRYQQAYQAAAKVIGIAGTLFEEILALGR
ncbi:MAG: flagellar hook-associated protein FlgK [Sulfuritalea sp.]|nr:flagellar hook-associated protein FlgK [Sulfuritalea sp.]